MLYKYFRVSGGALVYMDVGIQSSPGRDERNDCLITWIPNETCRFVLTSFSPGMRPCGPKSYTLAMRYYCDCHISRTHVFGHVDGRSYILVSKRKGWRNVTATPGLRYLALQSVWPSQKTLLGYCENPPRLDRKSCSWKVCMAMTAYISVLLAQKPRPTSSLSNKDRFPGWHLDHVSATTTLGLGTLFSLFSQLPVARQLQH